MVRIIHTEDLRASEMAHWPVDEQHWVYNGFDATLTSEILARTKLLLDPITQRIYNFERGLQAPALDMMLRGIRVDEAERGHLIVKLRHDKDRCEQHLRNLGAIFDHPGLNARSPKQLKTLFYSTLGLPEQTALVNGKWVVSTNRECLENLQAYLRAQPFIAAIFAIRDCTQQLSVLQTQCRDGRLYTSLNIGKETGRWSSSSSAFFDGRNLQNIMEKLRTIFIPDEGMKLGYADFSQAESNTVAHISGDENYILAHKSGDVHKAVALMVWPTVAEVKAKYYRDWSYRDLSKRGAHASNYFAKPPTIAKHLKIPNALAQEFQDGYFGRFDKIRPWQYDVIRRIQTESCITTALGRRRIFFGRPSDDTTLREGIAYEPQSIVADLLNTALYFVWRDVSPMGLQLLLPVHDAIFYQYPEHLEDPINEAVMKAMTLPTPITCIGGIERTMTLGVDIQVGFNWMKFNDDPERGKINLGGLLDWKDDDIKRQRKPEPTAFDPAAELLARRLS